MRRLLSLLALWLASPAFAQVVGGENLSNQAREVVLLAGVPHLPGATVDLNFAAGQYYTKGATGPLTVSRASSKTCADLSGNWKTVAANVACITNQGVLIEEARTNGVRNSIAAGGGVGTPGTLPTNWSFSDGSSGRITHSITALPSWGGLQCAAFSFSGTANAGDYQTIYFGTSTEVVASYGQTLSTSEYLTASAGFIAAMNGIGFQIGHTDFTSTPTFIGNYFSANLAGSLVAGAQVELQNSATIANSTTAYVEPGVIFTLAAGTLSGATLQICQPQIELNPNIPATVASAVTAASGTGGVNGTAVYQVSGGTGTAATLNCTWAAGVLTVNSVATAGSYNASSGLPASPATLTYVSGTATGWTGATVTLTPTDNSAQGFATSPILTSGSAATRAADNVSIGVAPGTASLLAICTPSQPTSSPLSQTIAMLTDGGNNVLDIFRSTAGSGSAYSVTNSASSGESGGAIATGANAKLSTIVSGTTLSLVINNGTPFTTSQASGPPKNLSKLYVGTYGVSNQQFNGYISRVAVSPSSLLPY